MAIPIRKATKKKILQKHKDINPIKSISIDVLPYLHLVKDLIAEKEYVSYLDLMSKTALEQHEALYVINFLVDRGVLKSSSKARFAFVWGEPSDICIFARTYVKLQVS